MTITDESVWDQPSYWSEPAERAFAKARRRAKREERRGVLRNHPSRLKSFDEVRTSRALLPDSRQLLRSVALDQIVGSVGKNGHFTRSFRPRIREMRARWKRVFAMAHGLRGYPPIELYQVDDEYYVVDGHYRVSVAVALGYSSIQAYVRRWAPATVSPLSRV
jgi:hypothetical protein